MAKPPEALRPGHTRIDLENLDHMTIKDGELYWKYKKIKADSAFSRGQKAWLWFVSGLGVIGTLIGLTGGAVNINKEFCFVESKSCPPENPTDLGDGNASQGGQSIPQKPTNPDVNDPNLKK